jgi:hypothetical protein
VVKTAETTNDQAMSLPPRVWDRRRPINYAKEAEMVGGIAAPLLAGFSLTTVAQLVISSYRPWLAGYAIAVFAVAAALLLNSLQFSATALAYDATPSERLDYVPEATSNTELLGVIRKRQWEELDLRGRYIRRARLCYNTGLLGFLGGFGLIIVPHRSWPWPAGQLIGVIAVGFALLFEALWIISNARWPKWLFPRASAGDPPDPKPSEAYMLDEDASNLLFGGARPENSRSGDILGNLRRCVELLEEMKTRH